MYLTIFGNFLTETSRDENQVFGYIGKTRDTAQYELCVTFDEIIGEIDSTLQGIYADMLTQRYPSYEIIKLDDLMSHNALSGQLMNKTNEGYHCDWDVIKGITGPQIKAVSYVNHKIKTVAVLHSADIYCALQNFLIVESTGYTCAGYSKHTLTKISIPAYGFAPLDVTKEEMDAYASRILEYRSNKHNRLRHIERVENFFD